MEAIRSQWAVFSAAPHRVFFWTGSLYAVVAVAAWTAQQASLFTSCCTPVFWSLPYPQAHGFAMVHGVIGFYFFGFLLTTFPRWLDRPPIARRVYLGAWGFLGVGAFVFLAGLYGGAWLSLAGGLAMMTGYIIAVGQCFSILLATENPHRHQPAVVLAGLTVGIAAMGIALYGFSTGSLYALRAAKWIGLYGFLLVVIFAVVFRMVPFFTSAAMAGYELRRSSWALPAVTMALLLRCGLGLAEVPHLFWLADGALFVLLLAELILWRFWQVRGPPLLTILYLALGWFLFSFALSTGESLYLMLSGAPRALFGNAALHALVVGGLGSLLLGIGTRVTLGHSGKGLVGTRAVHALFFGFQLVPVARITPEIVGFWRPEWAVHGFWAGGGWVLVFTFWFLGVGPILLRPRSDGRPG